MKTKEQLEAEAAVLCARARMNDEYCAAMERTTERTGGTFGHVNNPSMYNAHKLAAAEKRKAAADLRAEAQ